MGVGVLMTICKFSESSSDKTYEVRPDPNLQHEKTVEITCRYVRTRSSQYVLTLYAYVCTVLPPRSYYAYAYLVYTLASNIIITLEYAYSSMHTLARVLEYGQSGCFIGSATNNVRARSRVRARMHNKSEVPVPKISGHNQMRKNGGIP